MSRYCAHVNAEPLLAAADTWRDRCLKNEGSVFSDKSLWSLAYLEEIDRHFVNNLDEGEGNFFEKLETQLSPTAPEVKQLAAEMIWVMLLCPSSIGPDKKFDGIKRIWEWSGQALPENLQLLSTRTLSGVGSGGTAFNVGRWRELVYFVKFLKAFKSRPGAEQQMLLGDGWAMAELLSSLPEGETDLVNFSLRV